MSLRDEVASELATAAWRTATKTSSNGGDCVEVAPLSGGRVALRDTKDKGTGPVHVFTPSEWDAFLDGAKKGEFDF
ncbi:DUF397 domain-containing protein [Sphaerisporangium album]|uniref:DUF397 domain-containing protein n=1 Tax=Sphaerisporangium album TaxID=509200 RepID=A0A367EZ45_9ACTN|nr:DUF397 domain-containing protein [Sphaerisporangium album]RCG22825.1 DUF397 domain-containing protein [Sphaerisporangium album]